MGLWPVQRTDGPEACPTGFPMTIGIALPTLSAGDAIGNDVFGMTRHLRGRGYDVELFAWNCTVDEPVRRLDELPEVLTQPDDVLIYHHSISCEPGVRAVERSKCRTAVKYHNVTPPEYFADNPELVKRCTDGLKEVARLAKSTATIWADSGFNAQHVRDLVPGRKVDELPPFHQADELMAIAPDARSAAGLDDWATTLLVVGRVAPNKNIPLAVRAFADYRKRFDPRARLVIAGDRPVPEHAKAVEALARELGVAGQTFITGKVSTAQLKALYLAADVLLVTSSHEGFCVPLVEAMGLRVPIVAVPAAAVPFTARDAARYAEATPEAVAEQIRAVLGDFTARESQLARGRDRFETHFSNAAIDRQFGELFDELTRA